jgi:hypothetical protein
MYNEEGGRPEDYSIERGVGPRRYGTQEPFAFREAETPEGDRRVSVGYDETEHEPRLFPDAGVERGENGDEPDDNRLQHEAGDYDLGVKRMVQANA